MNSTDDADKILFLTQIYCMISILLKKKECKCSNRFVLFVPSDLHSQQMSDRAIERFVRSIFISSRVKKRAIQVWEIRTEQTTQINYIMFIIYFLSQTTLYLVIGRRFKNTQKNVQRMF